MELKAQLEATASMWRSIASERNDNINELQAKLDAVRGLLDDWEKMPVYAPHGVEFADELQAALNGEET